MVESKSNEESKDITMEKFAQFLNNKLDPKMKFKVLDMLDTREFAKVDEMDPIKNAFTDDKLRKFLEPDDEFCE